MDNVGVLKSKIFLEFPWLLSINTLLLKQCKTNRTKMSIPPDEERTITDCSKSSSATLSRYDTTSATSFVSASSWSLCNAGAMVDSDEQIFDSDIQQRNKQFYCLVVAYLHQLLVLLTGVILFCFPHFS